MFFYIIFTNLPYILHRDILLTVINFHTLKRLIKTISKCDIIDHEP